MSVCGCSRLSAGVERLYASLPVNRTFRNSSPILILRHFYRRGRGEKNAPLLSLSNADNFVSSLSTKERSFLQEALKIHQNDEDINVSEDLTKTRIPTVQQLRLAAFHSAIPFIGFGFLDNAIMIAAGEYIDITIGVTFGISTMAAAALGNIVSDVSGISLAHYVELAATKLGFEGPGLSSKQMEMPRTRFLTNLGRAIGIIIGCVLGMFPLFFLSSNKEEKETSRES